jgi:uncharacterized protein involved in exopolysaccharide biosynthesis
MSTSSQAPRVEARQFSTRDFLAMIFRRKWIILSILLVTLAMGVSASLKTTSEYQAVAKVLLRRSDGSSFQKARSPYLGLEEEMNTEIEILRSDPVLTRAIAELERELATVPEEERVLLFPPEEPGEKWHKPTEKWINKNLQAEPVEKSNVIMIRFRHTNAATARMLADAVASSYVAERISVRRSPMLESFFQERTADLQERLLDLRTEMGQIQVEAGIYDQEWQQRLNLGTLDDLRTELLRVRVNRQTEEAKIGEVRGKLSSGDADIVPMLEFEENAPFTELRTKLIDKKTILAELKGRYLPDHPKVKQQESLVQQLEEEMRREIETQVAMREAELRTLRAQEVALESAVQEIVEEMNRFPKYAPVIRQLEREIANTAELYEQVAIKAVDTQISETEDQRMVNAKVLSPATVSLSFVQQRRSLFTLFAAMLGLSLGLALAFLLEGLDHTFRSPEDVEIHLGVPLLGSIPDLKPARR